MVDFKGFRVVSGRVLDAASPALAPVPQALIVPHGAAPKSIARREDSQALNRARSIQTRAS